MLTTFVLIQIGVNAALLLAVVRLVREREATTRQAREREARLEALAADLCALGREATRQDRAEVPEPHDAPAVAQAPATPPEPDRHTESVIGAGGFGEAPDRFRAATALLARGMDVEDVAARTSLLPGEIQVLRNLRRAAEAESDAR